MQKSLPLGSDKALPIFKFCFRRKQNQSLLNDRREKVISVFKYDWREGTQNSIWAVCKRWLSRLLIDTHTNEKLQNDLAASKS